MQPHDGEKDCCREMASTVRPVRAGGCCGGEMASAPFEHRADLGRRRRVLVCRVALAGSAVLAVAALALTLAGLAPGLAGRLAWGAAIWASGLVLGWSRAALTAHRVDWRLVAALAAVVAGLVWQPMAAALVAVALLAERAVRPPGGGAVRPPRGETGAGDASGGGDLVLTTITGKPG